MIPTDESGEVKDLVQDILVIILVIISLCCRVFLCVLFRDTGPLQIKHFFNTGYFIIVPFDPVQKQQNSMRQKMFGIRCR